MRLDDASFVDFYEILDMERNAAPDALRRRISALYLEARVNLDHQNHRKRFYYVELYETHLPHARLILLDKNKRAEYDEELAQYYARKGTRPPAPRKPHDDTKLALTDLPGTATADVSFDDFADMSEGIPLPPPIPVLRMDANEVERRRDHKRRELIKHELISEGTKWGLIAGAGTTLCGIIMAWLLYNTSPGNITFPAVLFVLFVGTSFLASRNATRWAKRRTIGFLSTMPYDELLRHCGR